MPKLIATLNPVRGAWETDRTNLICGHSEPFLQTWPASGMTRDGQAYELPTSAPRTAGSACSSLPTPRATRGGSATETVAALLPTPRALDTIGPRSPEAHERHLHRGGSTSRRKRTGNLSEDIVDLLPTPRAAMGGACTDSPRKARLEQEVTLLPTPAVNDMGEGKTAEWWDDWTDVQKEKHGNGNGNGHGKSLAIEAQRLLPTPRASDPAGEASRSSDGFRPQLGEVARQVTLLPTPTSTDHKASGSTQSATGTHHVGTTLTDATVRQSDQWGDYGPAIARWETVTGHPAPPPTETGPKGSPRLSPAFVEWMMGLEPGHVTGTGISRVAQLKALGNGVVPRQAEAAIRHLLAVDELEAVAS